ncbi:hypothetical protein HYH03_004421 [Edaphochlamys debaryana]|uniref:F-box domain-containing protein n=1 Tax=Edaphochlamys debaryana TaxID=47281 RepID=A0A835Y9M4_9CHLO|nr:hypothetical protein HYH03_004421 [Edaphochlamys debaryana]|eukprot:KAG2497684.1 hypothetical protein HYH03_004421 [Edaphochlamys debaryana]
MAGEAQFSAGPGRLDAYSVAQLPREILQIIGSHLSPSDWPSARLTCRTWRRHITTGVAELTLAAERDGERWCVRLLAAAPLLPLLRRCRLLVSSRLEPGALLWRLQQLAAAHGRLTDVELRCMGPLQLALSAGPSPLALAPAGMAAFGGRLRVLALRGGAVPPPAALVALSALSGLRELSLLPGDYAEVSPEEGGPLVDQSADPGDYGLSDAHCWALAAAAGALGPGAAAAGPSGSSSGSGSGRAAAKGSGLRLAAAAAAGHAGATLMPCGLGLHLTKLMRPAGFHASGCRALARGLPRLASVTLYDSDLTEGAARALAPLTGLASLQCGVRSHHVPGVLSACLPSLRGQRQAGTSVLPPPPPALLPLPPPPSLPRRRCCLTGLFLVDQALGPQALQRLASLTALRELIIESPRALPDQTGMDRTGPDRVALSFGPAAATLLVPGGPACAPGLEAGLLALSRLTHLQASAGGGSSGRHGF